MNLKRGIHAVSIMMLLAVLACFSGNSYSRYFSQSTGEASMDVARWKVALKGTKDQEASKAVDIVFKPSRKSDNVGEGAFAPGVYGEASLILDLTDTEVAVDYNIMVDTTVLKKHINSKNMLLTMLDNEGKPVDFGKDTIIKLADQNKGFSGDKGQYKFKFKLEWKDGGGYDKDDTELALAYSTLSDSMLKLPIFIKVKQHIGTDSEGGRKKVTSNLYYAETTETVPRRETVDWSKTQDALRDNPERGFYSTSKMKLTESGLEKIGGWEVLTKSKASSLMQLKVDLSAFSGNMNADKKDKELTDAAVYALEGILEQIRQNNNTVILRFIYDNFAEDVRDDMAKFEPSQDYIKRHIAKLQPVFQKYATTINVIQIGFYGLWGESYYNTDVSKRLEDDPDYPSQKAQSGRPDYYIETVNALLNATSGTDITIAVRTPKYYTWYKEIDVGNIGSDITTSGDGAYRVGIFNDAYGASADDLGTYQNRGIETGWLKNQAAHTYYGGEAIVDSDYKKDEPATAIGTYNTATFFIDEAFKCHTSYLNWEWNQALHRQWATNPDQKYSGSEPQYSEKQALVYIENHLGYRFVVKEVMTYETVGSGETLPIDITVNNVGFANLIKSKRADIVITDSDGKVVETYEGVGINARDFLSRTTIRQSVEVRLPDTLTNGKKYKVYLRLSSGEKIDGDRWYSAIRFANSEMYNDALQANYIAEFTVDSGAEEVSAEGEASAQNEYD